MIRELTGAIFAPCQQVCGRAEITWILSPFETYWFCIKTKAGAFTNLPCGKVVSAQAGCGRIHGKHSRRVPALSRMEGKMATRFANHQRNDQVTRSGTLIGALVSFVCAPTIIRAVSSMRLRASVIPIKVPGLALTQTPQEGFVRRLLFASCDNALKAGRTDSTFCQWTQALGGRDAPHCCICSTACIFELGPIEQSCYENAAAGPK
jgi:hypothetical protein